MEGEESGGSQPLPGGREGRVLEARQGPPPVAASTESTGLTQTPRVRTGLLKVDHTEKILSNKTRIRLPADVSLLDGEKNVFICIYAWAHTHTWPPLFTVIMVHKVTVTPGI